MNAERWKQVEDCYHAAVERPAPERAGFLAQACANDPELRREVESLLDQGPADEILASPLWDHITSTDDTATTAPGALSAGSMMAEYRIVGRLGAGGMGEVYRAADTRLQREVALKVLAPEFAGNFAWMSRFQREARVLASLNHPHIAAVYGLEESGGVRAIAMELVEGPTLAERIARGRIPIPEALAIARQIADALEYAHEKGIVHRDLKPANVKLRPDGVAKVLDFGLAKAIETKETPTATATRAGVIMGTPAYMAPEQAAGQTVDRRADIWAFGVVLFEMLAGRQIYARKTTLETLAAVAREDPQWDALPAETPSDIRRLLRRCLDRDAKTRLRDIGEARIAVKAAVAGKAPLVEPAKERGGGSRPWLGWSVATLLAVGLAVTFLYFRERPPAPDASPEVTLSIVPPSSRNPVSVGFLNIDRISPDGSSVLYLATDGRFHIRRLGSLQDQPMPPFHQYGDPFWAPDSKSIAFPTATGLMKMQVPNGVPELVTESVVAGRGGSWGDNGMILVSDGSSLYAVPAAGGKAIRIEIPGFKEGRYYNPGFLPGGDDFLFAFAPSDSEGAQVFMATLRSGKAIEPRLLFSNDTAAAFASAGGGRILFVRGDNLYGQRLDVKGRHLVGDTELIQERVASSADCRNAYFSVSRAGTLVWRSGTAVTSQVTVFDRKGNKIGTTGTSVPVSWVRLSPDEAHVLVSSESGSWIMESNGPGRIGLGSAPFLFWSPDGSGIIGYRGGEIVQRPVRGGPQDSRPFALFGHFTVNWFGGAAGLLDISADGRKILYTDGAGPLWLSLDGERRPERVVDQKVDNAGLSPDGAWTVYSPLTERGIYVQPLTKPGLRRQIANSGIFAVWRQDGKEIMYLAQNQIWSVRVDGTGTQLRFAAPEPLFSVSALLGTNSGARPLAVSRDGSKIYYPQSVDEPDSAVINVHTRAIR